MKNLKWTHLALAALAGVVLADKIRTLPLADKLPRL